jgi:phosphate transport system substrate-binding protein
MALGIALLAADFAWRMRPCLADESLRIGGVGGALGTMHRLNEPFAAATGIKLEIIPSLGSSGGLKALQAGMLDVAVSGRPVNDKEAALGLRQQVSTRTPLVFVTATLSPGGFTRADLGSKLLGPKPRWPDGEPIRLILRHVTESDYLILFPMFPGTEDAVANLRRRPDVPLATSDQENLDMAERLPGALVTTTLAQVRTENRSLQVIPVDGVVPDLDALRDGRYPFAKTFHYVVGPRADDRTARFIAFLKSPDGQALLRETGSLP